MAIPALMEGLLQQKRWHASIVYRYWFQCADNASQARLARQMGQLTIGSHWQQHRGAKRIRIRSACPHWIILTLTNVHIKSQIVNKTAGTVAAEASTLQSAVVSGDALRGAADTHTCSANIDPLIGYRRSSVDAARRVGKVLGMRAIEVGITEAHWVRPARFHGKVRAFFEAFVESGIRMV